MNFLFSPYFENISTYYAPCKVLSRNSYGTSDYFNFNFRVRLAAITQFKNDRDELGRVGPDGKWRRSLNMPQQNKRGYFLMHLERCEGSQDSFLRFWAEVCVVDLIKCNRLNERKTKGSKTIKNSFHYDKNSVSSRKRQFLENENKFRRLRRFLGKRQKLKSPPPVGLEPTTFELEVQHASPLRHGGGPCWFIKQGL